MLATMPARPTNRIAPTPSRKPARVRIAYAERPNEFQQFSPVEFARYQDFIEALPNCPGFLALKQIIRDARKLSTLIRETLADYGPDSGSVLDRFNETFDEWGADELWNELVAMQVTIRNGVSFVSCNLPCMPDG